MANIFSKLVSKATFWDQADDQRIAREEEEERKRRNVQAVSSNLPKVPSQSTNQFNFNQPLVKDPLNPNQPAKPSFLVGGSQSEMMLQKPKPVVDAPKDTRSAKIKELDDLAAGELEQARKEQNDSEGWFGRNFLNKKAIEERAVSQARSRATTKFQDKYGWNADPEVLAFNEGTRSRQNVETERLRKDAKSLDDFSKGMDKVGEVAQYVPITGSVINLGLAGTEQLAKATGNEAYAKDIGDQRLRLDVGMNQEEFDKLDPETQQKLRNLQNLGLALSPLDFLGVGGLAKSGAMAAGKKAVIQAVKDGAVDAATKTALKKGLIAEGKSAIIPAIAGTGASIGGQAYLGGTDNIDYLEALKTGALTAGASKILPFESKKAAKGQLDVPQGADEVPVPKNLKVGGEFGLESLRKAEEGLDPEIPQIPGAKPSEGGTEIAPGLKSPDKPEVDVPNPQGPVLKEQIDPLSLPEPLPIAEKMAQPPIKPQIPDVTNPIALAKAADNTSTTTVATPQGGAGEVPMADFSKAINVPLQKADPAEVAPITPQPTQTDLAELAAGGDLRQSTRTAPEDALGNEALQSDAAVVGDLVDQGIAPTRQGSPVATSEEALQIAAAKAAEAEVDMAAPRTRAEAVNIIENESARLDAAETFKGKDVTNIAETQAAATTAIREIDDAGLISAFRAEPEIKTPQQFFETVAAVERLGKLDPADPAQVRALTNALDGLSSFSSRAGRDLRMVKELFANLPPAMRKQYLIDRIESKLGVELPDLQRTELLGKITNADDTQTKINDITGRLEEAQRNVELGAPVDEAVVMKDIDDLGKLQTVHEYQQGDAFQYSQDLLQSGTAGAKVAQATKTAMLSSPLRRTADVITTGITSASDTASNAISGVIGRALNKLPGKAGTFRETRAGDYKVLTEGNKQGFKDSLYSLKSDNRKVDDIMGELQKNTRSDANNAGRTRFGRAVGDMTEMATNTTQGQRGQRLRELARQEGQKLGLNGDDLDLYTQITEKIPNEIQKHEASQYHLRTNNLHDNKLNTAFRSVASVIEKQFPQAGPIVTALTVPFKSYQAGNLNRLFTDKTVLGNAFTLVQAAKRGDTQGVVDALGKAAVNTGETLVLGSILSSAGLLKDTNDNGEDWSGPYLQTPFGDIPVGFFGPTGINMIIGHNLSNLAENGDVDEFVNKFGKQALGFMNIEGSLGGNTPVQEVISGQGDVTDRLVKAGGDTLRRPIPSILGDLNAVGNTISGQDKALTKAKNEDGTTDYIKTEANRTIDKLGLSALLDRDEGKTSQNIIDRITGGTHSSDTTNEAESERDVQKSIKDMEKELKGAKVPIKDTDIEDALDNGDYDNAIKGLEYKVLKTENDPDATNSAVKGAKDELLQAQLRKEGVPVTEDGIKARTESGDYSEAILGSRYQLQKIADDENVPESKKQNIRDDITRLQVTAGGSYPPSVIALYSDTSQSEWRAMGNPESEDYDPETYQMLYQYDSQLKDKGVSKSSKGGDKPKFTVGKGGSGGGGRGGSNKGFTTSIALQKFEGGDGGKQKYLAADFAEPKSAIPVLQKTPNYDQSKKKKITVSKGGRS
jgi:hypothetical protein